MYIFMDAPQFDVVKQKLLVNRESTSGISMIRGALKGMPGRCNRRGN
jgi:hypothetical protein